MCSREEYLKRYLDEDIKKGSKKRRAKLKTSDKHKSRFKIVDEDLDIRRLDVANVIDECGDEAPVVADIIDERPEHIKMGELYDSSRWKKVGSQTSDGMTSKGKSVTVKGDSAKMTTSLKSSYSRDPKDEISDCSISSHYTKKSGENSQNASDSDLSPDRLTYNCENSHRLNSCPQEKATAHSDISTHRKKTTAITKTSTKSSSGSCKEPKVKHILYERDNTSNKSDRVKNDNFTNSDGKMFDPSESKMKKNSMLRLSVDSDGDLSPQRMSVSCSTQSRLQAHRKKTQSNIRYDSESDLSDDHNEKTSMFSHSDHKNSTNKRNEISDNQTIKSKVLGYGCDTDKDYQRHSARKVHLCDTKSHAYSANSSHHSSRNSTDNASQKSSGAEEHVNDTKRRKLMSTSSGMRAGLQDAGALRREMMELKNREENTYQKIGDEMSGRSAETVLRDKSTGKRLNLKEERLKQKEKERITAEQQEKYLEWGKGIKQKEEREKRLKEDVYEMSKPLARYRDDEDLERDLKEQLRADDPMLEYMLKKKRKQSNMLNVPVYSGSPAPPNRFNIMPGYRWDGVDRSNGFEKKSFGKHNEKKAFEEEAYKWSIQNM